jgi:quercetin dioxygenase-like cupin family protein
LSRPGTNEARIISEQLWGPPLDLVEGSGTCREVIGVGSGNSFRSLYRFELPVGSATTRLKHPVEAVYYVVSGSVEVSSSTAEGNRALSMGGMLHVRPFGDYAMQAQEDAVVIGGPCPVDPDFGRPAADLATPPEIADPGVGFFSRDEPGLMVPFISADARMVVWYGAGALTANMNYVVLEPGERNREHQHRYSEDTIFIIDGHGTLEDITNGRNLPFGPGDTVTIPPGVVHAVNADRGERIVSVGGPCPADLDMLRAAGVDVDALTAALLS